MKNTEIKEGDAVKLNRDYYITFQEKNPSTYPHDFRPHFIIEKDTVGIVKGKDLIGENSDEEKMDITHLQVTFTSYQGFKTGIWVSPEDVMLVN